MATNNTTNKRKVKVRIALAIDEKGNWGVAGGSGMSQRDAIELATDSVASGYYKIYMITVEVEAPRPVEVSIDLPAEAVEEAGL